MFVTLLAGVAKTLVISMLSEWASATSINSLNDRLVLEMKTKLEADGNL